MIAAWTDWGLATLLGYDVWKQNFGIIIPGAPPEHDACHGGKFRHRADSHMPLNLGEGASIVQGLCEAETKAYVARSGASPEELTKKVKLLRYKARQK